MNFAWWNHDVRARGMRLRRRYPREFDGMNLYRRAEVYADLLYRVMRTAAERMAAQCAALGGDGVIGVRLHEGPYPGDKHARQFTAAGTAVRAAGSTRAVTPFLACMPAQDFARLLAAGWVPADIAIGTACTWRDWSAGTAPRRRDDGNREPERQTEAIEAARATARDQMQQRAARTGADGIVLARMDMTAAVHQWGTWRGTGGYCVAEATVTGTTIVSFGPAPGWNDPPSPVIGLQASV